jgi:hypothetical protein
MADTDLIRRIDRSLERIDRHIERGDAAMERNNEVIERNTAAFKGIRDEFELNREVQVEMLRRFDEVGRRFDQSHREVLRRLEDLGVHMREQTQALIRIQARLAD